MSLGASMGKARCASPMRQAATAWSTTTSFSTSRPIRRADTPSTASVHDCLGRRVGETDESVEARCSAEFSIRVLRSVRSVTTPTAVPVNPAGPIPVVIPGEDGTQHSVFTPEEGGEAESADGACTLRVPVGAVANGEYVGAAIAELEGDLSDIRFAARGDICEVSMVDSSGDAVESYLLEDPAEVCMPVPPEFRSRIVDVEMAVVEDGGVARLVGSTIRIVGTSGEIALCGNVGDLPVTVAAVVPAGSLPPEALVTPAPSPVSPDTGGYFPASRNALVLLMLIAGAAVAIAVFVVKGPQGEHGVKRAVLVADVDRPARLLNHLCAGGAASRS